MAYSEDLKKRVMDFIREGGEKTHASDLYKVSRATIYRWLSQPADHKAGKPGPKTSHKFSREALRAQLEAKPDSLQKELAAHFKVSINAICQALKRMGIVRKKSRSVTRKA